VPPFGSEKAEKNNKKYIISRCRRRRRPCISVFVSAEKEKNIEI